MPGSVAVARQPLELKSLVRIQAGQHLLARIPPIVPCTLNNEPQTTPETAGTGSTE